MTAVTLNAVTEEMPLAQARRVRAQFIFDSYLEWREAAAHYATGATGDAAKDPPYLDWLRGALRRLDVVLIEGTRAGAEESWEGRVRDELKPHREGLAQINPEEFDNPSLRELIRGN